MFGGIQVPEANLITLLGVLFDQKLSFGSTSGLLQPGQGSDLVFCAGLLIFSLRLGA